MMVCHQIQPADFAINPASAVENVARAPISHLKSAFWSVRSCSICLSRWLCSVSSFTSLSVSLRRSIQSISNCPFVRLSREDKDRTTAATAWSGPLFLRSAYRRLVESFTSLSNSLVLANDLSISNVSLCVLDARGLGPRTVLLTRRGPLFPFGLRPDDLFVSDRFLQLLTKLFTDLALLKPAARAIKNLQSDRRSHWVRQ